MFYWHKIFKTFSGEDPRIPPPPSWGISIPPKPSGRGFHRFAMYEGASRYGPVRVLVWTPAALHISLFCNVDCYFKIWFLLYLLSIQFALCYLCATRTNLNNCFNSEIIELFNHLAVRNAIKGLRYVHKNSSKLVFFV